MKNFTLLLVAMLMISFSALAQIKMIVHLNDAEPIEVYASSVDSITFANFPVDPDDDPDDDPDRPSGPEGPIYPDDDEEEVVVESRPDGIMNPGAGKTTLVVYIPNSACTDAVPYVIGSLPGDGNWANVEALKMTRCEGKQEWWKVTLDALTPENATNFKFRMEDGEGGWTYEPISSYELLEGADDYLQIKADERNNLVAIDDCSNKVLYIKSGKWSFTPCNPIPAGYTKFVLTVKNKIPNNAKIIFTGSFEENSWFESDRVMTKEADGIYTWEGYYPEYFKFTAIIMIANCNIEYMTIGSGVSTYFVMDSNAGSEIEFSGTFYIDLLYFDEEDDDEYFTPDTNGHEYVDLGLPSGTLWATMNVGAESPEDYGDYFAWGETEPKDYYYWDSYKWMTDGMSSREGVNKYTYPDGQTYAVWYDEDGNFIGDNKTVLELADDAANVNWGGDWRMPTKEEQDELRTECTWNWTTKNGVNGYTVTSKTNGNSIFLPAAGTRYDSDLLNAGSNGYYWSSSLYTGFSDLACRLDFRSYNVDWDGHYRCYGLSVRPVLP